MADATPFRTATLSCPRCPTALSRGELGFCERCHGVWIPEPALRDRVSRMQDRPIPVLDWELESRNPLPCVACREPMQTLALFDVPIDRCVAHGLWFDRDELSTVLLHSRQPAVVAAAGAVAAAETTESSSSVSSSIGDGLDVVGGILELLGMIFSVF